jgi:hydrogenase/urease accessory protein HupE
MLAHGVSQAHHPALSSFISQVTPEKVDVFFELDAKTATEVWKIDLDGNNVVDGEEFVAGRLVVMAYVDGHFSIESDGQACVRQAVERFEVAANLERFRILTTYLCSSPPGRLRYKNTLFFEVQGGHRHVARIQVGDQIVSHVFERGAAEVWVDGGRDGLESVGDDAAGAPGGPVSEFFSFVWFGFTHILVGLDHMLFILALVLVVRSFGELALVISAFTVGHSVTLALGVLEFVAPAPALVETAIAVSIVYVGLENIAQKRPRARYVVTFIFGLVHGLGFSGVLTSAGMPEDGLIAALIAFNLGVECGQILWIAPVFPLVLILRNRAPKAERKVVVALSGAIAGLGVVWCLERALGFSLLPGLL